MKLHILAKQTPAVIRAVDWSAIAGDEAKRLRALGVDEGAEVVVTHRGVFGTADPLALRLGRMTIAVRRSHALAIEVDTATEEAR
ncbi:FeoA family protein [Qipengyuania spongiae]|uniref:Ferrous iron transport protein A n=1 Tax=Qipengyuania spongiae TaxID=2909673 RepID=A0ABY5SY47_9SPHN|nr:FeoA family protein [Qipengyuania spongiae]UVI39467.1 ferrous iron transport protein A [Qipengyuania spongiae]